jgi:hypothetical protein
MFGEDARGGDKEWDGIIEGALPVLLTATTNSSVGAHAQAALECISAACVGNPAAVAALMAATTPAQMQRLVMTAETLLDRAGTQACVPRACWCARGLACVCPCA